MAQRKPAAVSVSVGDNHDPRPELARILTDITCAHRDGELPLCDGTTLRERVLAVARDDTHEYVHPDCAATALMVNRDDVLRLLGGEPYGTGKGHSRDGWYIPSCPTCGHGLDCGCA